MQDELHQLRVRLRTARLEARKTQAEVAAALGKPQSFVSKLETGERRASFAEVVRLARIYRTPITYFAGVIR